MCVCKRERELKTEGEHLCDIESEKEIENVKVKLRKHPMLKTWLGVFHT